MMRKKSRVKLKTWWEKSKRKKKLIFYVKVFILEASSVLFSRWRHCFTFLLMNSYLLCVFSPSFLPWMYIKYIQKSNLERCWVEELDEKKLNFDLEILTESARIESNQKFTSLSWVEWEQLKIDLKFPRKILTSQQTKHVKKFLHVKFNFHPSRYSKNIERYWASISPILLPKKIFFCRCREHILFRVEKKGGRKSFIVFSRWNFDVREY